MRKKATTKPDAAIQIFCESHNNSPHAKSLNISLSAFNELFTIDCFKEQINLFARDASAFSKIHNSSHSHHV